MSRDVSKANEMVGGALIGVSMLLIAVCGFLFFQGKSNVALPLTVVGVITHGLGVSNIRAKKANQKQVED